MSQSPPDTSVAHACPVCGAGTPDVFLARRNVPVHQNLLCRSLDEATALACGQLTMSICPHCGFATNQAFDASLLRYGEQYDNTQMYSPAFEQYVGERIAHLIDDCGVQNASIIEVGCGKGHFLQKLVASHPGNQGHGFDPSYLGAASMFDGRLQFHRRFYDASCANLGADVVICRHVIEHIEQPLRMLRDVRQALRHAPHARVFFETPCLNWILKHQVAWDFFYEHCSLFTAESLATAFRRTGFDVHRVDHVFGGQYLWMEVSPRQADSQIDTGQIHTGQIDTGQIHTGQARDRQEPAAAACEPLVSLARAYGATEHARNLAWRLELQRLSQTGGIAIWGAGAKGVTLANLVDPDRKWIRCLIDVNPHKQGQYLPGTGHLIVPPTAIPAMRVSHVILLNPNYRAEVARTLAELQLLHVSLVDLMQEKAVAA